MSTAELMTLAGVGLNFAALLFHIMKNGARLESRLTRIETLINVLMGKDRRAHWQEHQGADYHDHDRGSGSG